MNKTRIFISVTAFLLISFCGTANMSADEVVRPTEIKSKREIYYDQPTYEKLSELWKSYYDEYPSEYAYANWMYAARYAGQEDYARLLDVGLEKYSANPTLLYLKSFGQETAQERKYLERAVHLDPSYADSWFGLMLIYMKERDEERMSLAMRHLLESGVIADEVMDFNYNTLIGLDENTILITNGDNDSFPAWILTRLLQIRPDVKIVNRGLLNTEWYPMYIIEQGLPRFISESQLQKLRNSTGGLVSDTLIKALVISAERARRPVCFSGGFQISSSLKELADNGRKLGMATLVTSSDTPYNDQLRKVFTTWTTEFLTGGLDSWRLRHAPKSDAGRLMMGVYASRIANSLPELKKNAPELRLPLFNWYVAHVERYLGLEFKHYVAKTWACYGSDLTEIDEWCKNQGVECRPEPQKN